MFKFLNSVKVSDNTWKMAFNFLYGDSQGLIQQVESSDKYKLTTGNLAWFDVKQFEIKNLKAVFHYANNVSEVTLNRHEWAKSTCTCGFFLKNYSCYHVLVVALKFKYIRCAHIKIGWTSLFLRFLFLFYSTENSESGNDFSFFFR